MAVSGRRHSVDTRIVTTQAQLSPRAAAALGLVFTTAGLFILLFALGVALIIGFALTAGAGPDG